MRKEKGSVRFDVEVRPYDEKLDRGYVFSTWVGSYAEAVQLLPQQEARYLEEQERSINRLMRQGQVSIACLSDARSVIAGWCCHGRGRQLHYLYVRPRFRRKGVGNLLVFSAVGLDPFVYTCRTDDWESMPVSQSGVFDPIQTFKDFRPREDVEALVKRFGRSHRFRFPAMKGKPS